MSEEVSSVPAEVTESEPGVNVADIPVVEETPEENSAAWKKAREESNAKVLAWKAQQAKEKAENKLLWKEHYRKFTNDPAYRQAIAEGTAVLPK